MTSTEATAGEGVADGTDLTWLLTHGAGMAWQYAMAVQTAVTDTEAAAQDGNHPACVEACRVALRAVAYCTQVGRGYPGQPTHLEHHLQLAFDDSPAAQALRTLGSPADADEHVSRQARAVVTEEADRLREALPVQVPVIRTAQGYFPTIRVAGALERLRTEHGLGPVDWDQWGI